MPEPSNPIKATFYWVGSQTDKSPWVSPSASGLAVIISSVLFANPSVPTLSIGAVALAGGVIVEIAAAVWRRAEEKENGNARAHGYAVLNTVLLPLTEGAATIASATADDQVLFGRVCQHAVQACVTHTGPEGARAMLFAVSDSSKEMHCIAHAGDRGASVGFVSGRRRDRAFKTLEEGKLVYVASIAAEKESETRTRGGSGVGYDTFITAPVAVGDKGYGLLTVDAPAGEIFTESDIKLVALAAANLSVVFGSRARIAENGERDR